jgi:hypothetical protein
MRSSPLGERATRARRQIAAVLVAAAACAVAAAPASAQNSTPQWIDGTTQFTYGNSCILLGQPPAYQTQVGGFTGYWGAPDASYPRIGDRYWGHVYYTVTGLGCGLGIHGVQTEIALPQGTSLAIDAASQDPNDRIRCYRTNLNNTIVEVTNVPWQHPGDASIKGKHCDPTQVSQGANGAVLAYTLLAQGQSLHIVFPLRSTKKLSGIGEPNNASRMTATLSEPGITTSAQPFQWNFVGDRPVEPTCAALGQQTTTAITNTTAHSKGFFCNWYRPGKVEFEIGEGTSGAYQSTSPQYNVESQYQGYVLDQDWTGLKPGTDYHWRLRFTDTKGTATTADDQLHLGQAQTFKTTGAAPAPGSGGPPSPGTGGTGGDGGTAGGMTPPADTGNQDPGTQDPVTEAQQPQAPQQPQDQPPADTQAPSLTAAIGRARLGDVLKKGLKLTATCSEGCTVRAQLQIDAKTAKKLKLGKQLVTIAAGTAAGQPGRVVVPLKLTAKAKKALKRTRSLKATLVVTATDAAGNVSAPVRKSVTLKR